MEGLRNDIVHIVTNCTGNAHSLCRNGNYTTYSVAVTESSPSLKVSSVFTSVLEAYPAEITQKEPQYMRLTDNHYFYSPYVTETQKATFKLASSSVESFTKLAPFTSKGASIQFGPYENVAPFSVRIQLCHISTTSACI